MVHGLVGCRRLADASARSSTDRASDYGSEGWGFESLRARPGQRPFRVVPSAPSPGVGANLGAIRNRGATGQSPAHGLGGCPPVALDQVAIHVLGDRDTGMAQHLGDHMPQLAASLIALIRHGRECCSPGRRPQVLARGAGYPSGGIVGRAVLAVSRPLPSLRPVSQASMAAGGPVTSTGGLVPMCSMP
jgi:hypothetical protein